MNLPMTIEAGSIFFMSSLHERKTEPYSSGVHGAIT